MFWGPWYYDATIILVIIGSVISLVASGYMQSTYNKYGQIGNKAGITGAQFAALMMKQQGLDNVRIQAIAGNLSDNYNPRNKSLNLSQTTYSQASIGAIGVAGHEVGHAMQDEVSYWAFMARSWLVPITNIGSRLSFPIILVGALFQGDFLVNIGLVLFSLTLVFNVVTLPVELNASKRALASIEGLRVLTPEELKGARKVLRAAALTYVAAIAASLLSLLRMVALFGNRRRN